MVDTELAPGNTPDVPPSGGGQQTLKRLAVWGVFLGFLYVTRDFFFLGFMTFLFSYMTLSLVGWLMKRLSPGKESPGLRVRLTLGVFLATPLLLIGVGLLVGPPLLGQVQRMAGWLSHVSPEAEVSRRVEGWVGPSEFRSHYGDKDDPRYKEGLEEFRKSGFSHVDEYSQFPKLEAWVESGFSKQFLDAEQARIRARLLQDGTSSKEFETWFVNEKIPELQEQAKKQLPEKGRSSAHVDPLVVAAATAKPEELLHQARRDPALLASLRQEWVQDAVRQGLATAKHSPTYEKAFRDYYDKLRAKSPQTVPYTFDQYLRLQQARPQGEQAFGKAYEELMPTAEGDREARLRTDFEAAKQRELFHEWWGASPAAQFLRRHFEGTPAENGALMDRIFNSLINVPADLGTALLLSLFICVDFPRLRDGLATLRGTWLRDVYEEIAGTLGSLGRLIGRSLYAQGLIALSNALLMFVGLTLIGVDHEVLLSVATFILCLIPTLGAAISWALIAACALLQPGGGFFLAAKATGVVAVVALMETFVFSPRILGKMMELHPVMIIALLPVAQYFFGIWGLILATPVAVYVVHVVILGRGLPGMETPKKESPAEPAAAPSPPAAVDGESKDSTPASVQS